MNKLALLLLEHLDAAGDYMVPEATLKTHLCRLVRPVATEATAAPMANYRRTPAAPGVKGQA